HVHDIHSANGHAVHAPTPPRTGWRRWTGPGWLRALWFTPAFGSLWLGITVLLRWAANWHPLWKSGPIVTVALVSYPAGFLAAIGAFDYWLYYMSGRPTQPDLHEGHGARSWRDYFRPNPDHKVIGIQYLCTVVFFFIVGGFLALLFRAELAHPGDQYFNPQTFNVLVSNHAALMIFLVVIPGFAALGNFVIPLMIGAADMAFPKLNALSFWLLPIAGLMLIAGMAVAGGELDHDRAQLPRHDHHDARPRDDLLAHAAARVGELLDLTARRPGDAVHRRLAVLRHVRPGPAHELLRVRPKRLHPRLPAHLLVLLASGGLHHGLARLRDHLGDHRGDESQADLRLQADGALAARDPHPRLLRLGAPHGRGGDGELASRPYDGDDAADRGADGDQGVLVVSHDVGRQDPLHDADALRGRVRVQLRHRRPLRHLPRR